MKFDRDRFADVLLGWIFSTLILAGALVPAYIMLEWNESLFSNNGILFDRNENVSYINTIDYLTLAWITVTIYWLCRYLWYKLTPRPIQFSAWLYRASVAFFVVGYLSFFYRWLPHFSICKRVPTEDANTIARTCSSYQVGLYLVSLFAVALLVASLFSSRQPSEDEGIFE